MTKSQRVKHEMLVRVSNFGATYADRFPEGTTGQQGFAALNAAIALYETSNKARSDMKDGARGPKQAARAVLLFRMNAIIRTARAIALEEPGADSRFQPPAQTADTAILASARGYLDRLEPMKEAFVKRNLPASFVDDFRRSVDRFAQALNGRYLDKTGRSDARAAARSAIRQGLKAARLLDVIVLNTFPDDAKVLDDWKRLRRVDAIGSSERASADDPAPAPQVPGEAAATPPQVPDVASADDPLRRAS